MKRRCVGALAAAWLIASGPAPAVAAELEIFATGSMADPLQELGREFTAATHHTLRFSVGTTGAVSARIRAGETGDVLVISAESAAAFETDGTLAAGTRTPVASALFGVIVKAGAPTPSVSTPEALRQTVLRARTLSYPDPAAATVSGGYIESVFRQLGIAAEARNKASLKPMGYLVGEAVANGEVELGLSFLSEFIANKKLQAVPFPNALQKPQLYSAGVFASTSNAEAARAFIAFVTSEAAREKLRAAGVEPATPAHQVATAQPAATAAATRDVTAAAIPGVIAAGARWQLVWQGTDNADGILGTAEGGVLFAQEQPRRVGQLSASGEYSVFLTETHGVGSLSMTADGRLFAVERTCTDPGRRTGGECTEPTAVSMLLPQRRVLADSFDGKPLGRLNDLVVHGSGGAFFTVGGAYYVDRAGKVTSLGEGLTANGIMLSPNEKTLYVTNRDLVVAFDVGADGVTSNRRDFAKLAAGGAGDGIAVDATGRVYVTSQPGVQVFAPDGAYLGLIATPRPVISAAFSGAGKKTLYAVGSGAALGPNGTEFVTPQGVRNNAKTIYKIDMLAAGFAGRPK